MHILGVSSHYHDSAAALVRDGSVVAAAQEERFSRIKHDASFPDRAIDFCLDRAGIVGEELDYVVFYEKPLLKFERTLQTALHTFPRSWRAFGEAMINWFDEKLWVETALREKLGVPSSRVLFTEHHLSHAASALLCSPFEEAAILTTDGVGEWTTTAMGTGRASWNGGGENRIRLSREQRFPHSLGLLYSAFTAWLGFRVNNGEYKVMGMASYGEPRYVDRVRQVIRGGADGSFRLDLRYFSFHRSIDRTFSPEFEALFGSPRQPGTEFVVPGVEGHREASAAALEANQYYADVAASVQRVTEELMLRMVGALHAETGLENLCMAGGVALNSVANGRIVREGPFRRLYVQPAAGDAGGAVGAALYAWNVMLGRPRSYRMDDVYLGADYSPDEIAAVLDRAGVAYRRIDDEDRLVRHVARELTAGKVAAWFQGRFEWGPRALGNRSILADPRRAETKDVVNTKIKFREPFRPFAPVVPAERAPELFEDSPVDGPGAPSDFMLTVMPWREEVRDRVQAVDHMGTGRLQTIRREVNPLYHGVVEAFGEETGTPVLLNTSFNLRGEPIVTSPSNALRTFGASGMDLLAIGPYLVEK